MSRQVCKHRGIKLPDDTTCGGLCETFPGCLPLLSADLLGQVVDRWTLADSEIEAAVGANEGVRDALCALTLTGTRPSAWCLTPAWRSGPVVVLPALLAARSRAGLAGRSPRPPAPTAPVRPGRHPAAVAGGPPGRGRRGHPGRAVVPARRPHGRDLARPRSATACTCCLAPWPTSASVSPMGASSPAWPTLASGLRRWPAPARRSAWTGWLPGCRDPGAGSTRRCCTTPSATPTPPRALRCRPSTAICCGWTVAGRAAAMSTSSSNWQGCRGRWMRSRSPAGWTGVPRAGQDARALACAGRGRRTKDRLSDAQRTFNRVPAGLRALVEQAIAQLAGAWALRRWRGLLYRVRDVYRAAGALVCLGRWLHRGPT
jgi:hypothetical protein